MTMHTERLYELDSYIRRFQARVTAEKEIDGEVWTIFDKTLFYPESGGQPPDHGLFNGIAVLDVREEEETVLHRLEHRVKPGTEGAGEIDWDRRFDHMQQHSGQHILSQAFVREASADTRGFHLGSEVSTLDLSKPDLSLSEIENVEKLANQIIQENRPVKIHRVSRGELDAFPLRREIKAEGIIRLVEVEDFECTGCCGTHVRRTGDIGLIKVLKSERYKGGSRIHFVCGSRAVRDYQKKHQILDAASRRFSASESDLLDQLEKMDDDHRKTVSRLKSAMQSLLSLESIEMLDQAESVHGVKIVTRIFMEREMGDILSLLKKMIGERSRIVLFGIEGERPSLLIGRSEDVDLDLRTIMQSATEELGFKGGGSASLVQGRNDTPCKLGSFFEEWIAKIKSGL